MTSISNPKIYDQNWYKQRAFSSLEPIAPHVWDFSDSLLLYTASGTEEYESLQNKDTPYFKLVTAPERVYLQSIAAAQAEMLPAQFEYVDLGPGTEHKEQFLFDELKKRNKTFTYVPVDISSHYLQLAAGHAAAQGIAVKPIQASFEEIAQILGTPALPRFVNLGLTFTNYDPQTILGLLSSIAGSGGYVFVNVQIRDRVDMAALQKIYAVDAATMADDKLKLLGFDPAADISPRKADDQIKVWCSVLNIPQGFQKQELEVGDTLLVFQSLRYTLEQFETELRNFGKDYDLFETGAPFVGALIKT